MYTIEEGMAVVWQDPTMIVIAAFITYGFGFAQYGCSMYMQVKNKQCPFYFWMHCWYFGHDIVFSLLFYQWFYIIGWWLFEVLCIGCMMFVCIEAFSLYRAIRYERQEIWGRFTQGAPVSVRYAIVRGLIGYAIGALLFCSLRIVVGDPMCLFLMMSTNAILALMVQRRYDEIGVRQPGSVFLAWATLFGTCFTFAPSGIGFFATMVAALDTPVFYLVGVVCVACSIRAIYLAHTMPKNKALLNAQQARKNPQTLQTIQAEQA